MASEPHEAPDGWRLFAPDDAFQVYNGPLFQADPFAASEIEPLRLGFRVAERHCGFPGMCHGGMIATVLDCALGRSIQSACGITVAPTVSLTIEYMRAGKLGDWLESRVRILRKTRSMVFADSLLVGPEGVVAKATSVFKVPSSPK